MDQVIKASNVKETVTIKSVVEYIKLLGIDEREKYQCRIKRRDIAYSAKSTRQSIVVKEEGKQRADTLQKVDLKSS